MNNLSYIPDRVKLPEIYGFDASFLLLWNKQVSQKKNEIGHIFLFTRGEWGAGELFKLLRSLESLVYPCAVS